MLVYSIALTFLKGVGNSLSKKLYINTNGEVEQIWKYSKRELKKVDGIGEVLAENIFSQREEALERAQKELIFIKKNGVNAYLYTDKQYPYKLTYCNDSPFLIYTKGNYETGASQRQIAIVGTRNCTAYGKKITQQIIEGLQAYNVNIISGLAYGIDIAAHTRAMECNMPTIAVVAHGLNTIYPSTHAKYVTQMLDNGGIITEYPSGTPADREHFPERNRIVAGMTDATIVIEAGIKGGALITAHLAHSYNREVFAIPGKVGDVSSEGTNNLIKRNIASLAENANDIVYAMGWENSSIPTNLPLNLNLFTDFSDTEMQIMQLLKEKTSLSVDELALQNQLSISNVLSVLFELEMKGCVISLPGKIYTLA